MRGETRCAQQRVAARNEHAHENGHRIHEYARDATALTHTKQECDRKRLAACWHAAAASVPACTRLNAHVLLLCDALALFK